MSRFAELEKMTNDVKQSVAITSKENSLQNRFDEAKLTEYKQGTTLRFLTFLVVSVLVSLYLIAVIIIVFLVGCYKMCLSSSVLIALLSTTTANIVGLFLIVVKGLFRVK